MRLIIGDHIPPGESVQEIGQCKDSHLTADHKIACNLPDHSCPHQSVDCSFLWDGKLTAVAPPRILCTREAAALTSIERYEKEVKEQLPRVMPAEGGTGAGR